MVYASKTVRQSAPYMAVDVYCFEAGKVKVMADVGGPMGIGFTLDADTAEGMARSLLEVVEAARKAAAETQ